MHPAFLWLKLRLLGISLEESSFARRGFYPGGAGVRTHLEHIGRTFITGYHEALGEDEPHRLARILDRIEPDQRGFAYEGAATGLACLDFLSSRRCRRLQRFLNGPGKSHIYMIHVGVGWALARVPWLRRVDRVLNQLDPILRWLALDGYGFHSGYFDWRRYIRRQVKLRSLSNHGQRVFDQGLGRSLWFVDCADVPRITQTIAAFRPGRHGDLWSGVGLACAYAGGVTESALLVLKCVAGPYLPEVAQGAAFAAQARTRAGNLTNHTELACQLLCGMSAGDAARITDEALAEISSGTHACAYEDWRKNIQKKFALDRYVQK